MPRKVSVIPAFEEAEAQGDCLKNNSKNLRWEKAMFRPGR